MIEVLRISKSLKPVFPGTAVLQPGEHCDLAVILSSDYTSWMDAAAQMIHPVVVDTAEDAVTFLRGMQAVAPGGIWPKELDNDKFSVNGSAQA